MTFLNEIEKFLPLWLKNGFHNKFYFNKLISDHAGFLSIKDEKNVDSFVELDNHIIYVIIDNLYHTHFWHYNVEVVLHLQFYLNYLKKKHFFRKCQFKIISRPGVLELFQKEIFELINNDELLICEPSKCYKGNFFSFNIRENIWTISNNINAIEENFCFSIYDKLIDESNKKYTGSPKVDKLWISRRNFDIKTYWHKRFITNLNDVAPCILENGFIETHFPIEDIYRQIYLANNCNLTFGEIGTSMINILFMKKGSLFITETDPPVPDQGYYFKFLGKLKGVNVIIYDKINLDYEAMKTYNLSRETSFNLPHKFEDPEDFKIWFDKILKTI